MLITNIITTIITGLLYFDVAVRIVLMTTLTARLVVTIVIFLDRVIDLGETTIEFLRGSFGLKRRATWREKRKTPSHELSYI